MADDCHFSLKFVGWTSFIKDIVRTLAIRTGASGSLTVQASVSLVSTEGTAGKGTTVFLWVPKAPAFLALAGRGAIRSYWEEFTS